MARCSIFEAGIAGKAASRAASHPVYLLERVRESKDPRTIPPSVILSAAKDLAAAVFAAVMVSSRQKHKSRGINCREVLRLAQRLLRMTEKAGSVVCAISK